MGELNSIIESCMKEVATTTDFSYFKKWELTPEEKEVFCRSMHRHQCLWVEPRYKFSAGFEGPFYGDMRKVISDPQVVEVIGKKLAGVLTNLKVEVIAACSMSGDAWAVAASLYSGIPLVLLRKEPHYHGPESVICGFPFKHDTRIALLEDSIGSGGQLISFYKNLEKEGYTTIVEAVTVVDLFHLRPSAEYRDEFFRSHNLTFNYLVSINEYLDWLLEHAYVTREYHDMIVDWFADPVTWSGNQENWDRFEKLRQEGKVYFKDPEDVLIGARL